MTVKEAAKELTCSISFIYKLMRIGQLAYEMRGKRKLPVAASVEEYRQRNLVPAQKPLELAKSKRRKEPYQYEFL
jgi:excisionase family DNA binding protein